MFNFFFILLFLINGLVSLSFFILAVVFFFLEARNATRAAAKRTLVITGVILTAGLANALMMRYAVVFPKVGGYDLNSAYYLIRNLISAVVSFFTYIFYLRTGQGLSKAGGAPGSLLLDPERTLKKLDWKWILFPVPFLVVWTFFWFGIAPPQPTELALAASPEGDSLMAYVYTFFTASFLAPVTEEILYRHFAMGLFAKLFGDSKLAVILNVGITSLIFAIAHSGVVTEDWIKIIQILPAGLAFGWINKKKGLEHSILAHSAFNTLIIPVSMVIEFIGSGWN